jgi:hypothetical protein
MGIFFYMARYLIDRIMLLRWSSFHPTFSYNLTKRSLILASTSVLVFAIGNYLNSWLYFNRWVQKINLVSLLIAVVYTIFIWADPVRKVFFKQNEEFEKKSYSESINQEDFFHNYYNLNPATKLATYSNKNVKYIGVNSPLP